MKFQDRRIGTCLVLWSILTALVSGCSFTIERLDQPIATIRPSATSPAVTATFTPLPVTKAIPTPTAQPAPELSLAQACIPVEEKMPDDLILSGVWVRNRGKPYLEPIDGSTAYGIPLRGGGLFSTSRGDMAISPNGKYLAYIDSYFDTGPHTKSRVLRIINSTGRSLSTDYWTLDWQWLIGWPDNQHIAVFTGNKEILILEPFTGKWERFPKPSWLARIEYDYYGNDGPFYSPDLHSMWIKPDDSSLELRDFKTGQTIYTDKGNGYLNVWDLDWSADGSTLAIGVEKSLHIITGNQQAIKLDVSELDISSVNYPKLSPNGQKLTFTSSWSGKLFFLDIPQLTVTKLCTDEFNFFTEAVWSPYGRFVVQEVDGPGSGPFDLLIDTQQMHAYKLTSGRYQHRLVWLAEP